MPYLGEEEECIELAKTFDSYKECVEHNKLMNTRYGILLEARKVNPFPPRIVEKKIRKETIIK
jgi:hypothetical protein